MATHGPDTVQADRDAMVVQHLPLVRIIAARLYRLRWNGAVGYDEYCQLGSMGLLEAASRFDPSKGASFATFATWRIRGAILNGLEHSTEQHQQVAARKRLVQSRVDVLADTAPPVDDTGDEVAAALLRLSDAAIGLAVGFMLEGTGMFDNGHEADLVDGYTSLAMRERRQRLHAALATLPEPQRRVIEGHYLQQLPFAELADAMSLSRGRIAQLHRAGLERLRDILHHGAADFEA